MNIFISEFFSGGGLSAQDIPSSLLSEGFAMLSAVVNDFRRLSEYVKITTTLDYRIKKYTPPLQVDNVIEIDEKDNYADFLERIRIRMIDMALIIAPETGEILSNLTKIIEDQIVLKNLGSNSKAIQTCTNKFKTYEALKNIKVKVPKTKLIKFNGDEVPSEIFEFPLPFILKPLDGVAGAGISLIEDLHEDTIKKALNKITHESSESGFLIQEFIPGHDISVSLITNSEITIPLSVNFQEINLKNINSEYQGGYVPYEVNHERELFEISKKIISEIKGLNGYVGIDYVINENG
ncbi:MAG: ATP-grasp domain-containing protein, partial [Candidatus Helarchaeota archaeon]